MRGMLRGKCRSNRPVRSGAVTMPVLVPPNNRMNLTALRAARYPGRQAAKRAIFIVHMPEDRMSHRAPWECTFAKEQRSRCLPAKKPRTDHKYFEVLSLCILQAGLSWASVRRSWPRYWSAFLDFEIAKLAHATPAALLRRPGALRNRKKVAALVANARSEEHTSELQSRPHLVCRLLLE